jgi:hypothetical protein
LLCCAGEQSTRRGDRVMVAGYPPEIQAAYRVFAVRCSRCHTLARPLNAHITDPAHWVRYVARMRRQPTSGINRDNAEIILRFLIFYAREQQRAAAAEEQASPVEQNDAGASSAGRGIEPGPADEPAQPAAARKSEPPETLPIQDTSTPDATQHGRSP